VFGHSTHAEGLQGGNATSTKTKLCCFTFVLGFVKDKDFEGYASAISQKRENIIFVKPAIDKRFWMRILKNKFRVPVYLVIPIASVNKAI